VRCVVVKGIRVRLCDAVSSRHIRQTTAAGEKDAFSRARLCLLSDWQWRHFAVLWLVVSAGDQDSSFELRTFYEADAFSAILLVGLMHCRWIVINICVSQTFFRCECCHADRFNKESLCTIKFCVLSNHQSVASAVQLYSPFYISAIKWKDCFCLNITSTKGTMDPEGARLLTYLLYYVTTISPACRLCINIHHYAPPRIVLQQASAVDAALHALRRQYSSEGSMSSFKSITWNRLL